MNANRAGVLKEFLRHPETYLSRIGPGGDRFQLQRVDVADSPALAAWRGRRLPRTTSVVMVLALFITLILAYLAGSIPTGFLVARAMRVDITRAGSGNIGATNVFRVLGKGPGALVLTVDLFKGALAVRFAPALAVALAPADSLALPALAALGAVLGHNYTCWLGFKGGKGVATSAGAMAALIPPAFGVTVITWLVVFFLSRYVSLASIAGAIVLPVATAVTVSGPTRWPLVGFTTVLAALAVWRHRANIERLKAGTEHRFGKAKPSAS